MLRISMAAVLVFSASPSHAAGPAGCWALKTSDTALMQFRIAKNASGWTGIWRRPAHFSSDGDSFSRMTGPVIERVTRSAREIPGGVELTFDDPAPGSIPDTFILRPEGDKAQLEYIAFRPEPATLVRVSCQSKLGAWDASRTYVRAVERPTNIEMTAIFEADQAARSTSVPINWAVVSADDRRRRSLAQTLLDAGRLQSAEDFYHAAFVFQHGDEPGDFLKAHALAVIAVARGKPAATWIAAATLDRYLQAIGQPQIYGTQYSNAAGSWTQSPYQRALLPDSLRKASRVPSLEEQERQRLEYTKQGTKAATSPP